MRNLEEKLRHAFAMEKRASTRVARAATLLKKWQRARQRITRQLGEAEVQRIVNSEAAIREITKQKNTVRKTVTRLTGGQHEAK